MRRQHTAADRPRRLVMLTPIEPSPSGNGLAMRTELFRRAAPPDMDVQSVVVPVAGRAHGQSAVSSAIVPPDAALARAGAIALATDRAWRDRLAQAGPLPPAARAASPGLADAVIAALSGSGPLALHVMRAYMAPLGVAVAERVGAAWTTLDFDEDEAAFARSVGDLDRAAAHERMLDVFAPLFDGCSAASATEAGALGARLGLAVEHLPNAVQLAPGSPLPARAGSREIPSLLFVGNLTYWPNREAAELLVRVIAPAVRRHLGRRVVVTLAGPHDGQLDRLRGEDVAVTGFVADLAPLYAAADAVVVPLLNGAGTRIKLLEAFAHGVPAVASRIAVAGLDVVDGRHLLVADTREQAVAAIESILTDRQLAERLADEAAALVRDRYSTDVVLPLIRDFFERAATRASQRVQLSGT